MTTNNEKASASKSPSHVAYQIREMKDGKGFWTRIGTAWKHADEQGFNIQLDAVPLDGKITLRLPTEKAE